VVTAAFIGLSKTLREIDSTVEIAMEKVRTKPAQGQPTDQR
jgi:hypothetical protein